MVEFLLEKGVVISEKSCLFPHQQVLWLGKVFDLEVVNIEKMLRKCLGIAIKTACSPISPKRVTGKM